MPATIVSVQPPALIMNVYTCFGGSIAPVDMEVPGIDMPGLPNTIMLELKMAAQPLFDFIEMFVKPIILPFLTFLIPPQEIPIKVIKIAIKLSLFVFAYPVYTMQQALDKLTNEFLTITSGITDAVTGAITEVQAGIAGVQQEVADQLNAFVAKAASTKAMIAQLIFQTLLGLITDVGAIIKTAIELISNPMKLAELLAQKVGDKIAEVVAGSGAGEVFERVKGWMSIVKDVILGAMKMVTLIFALPIIAVKAIIDVVKGIIKDIKSEFTKIVTEQVNYFINKITEPIKAAIAAVSEALQMGQTLMKLVDCTIKGVVSLITGLPGNVADLISLITLTTMGLNLPAPPPLDIPGLTGPMKEEIKLDSAKQELVKIQATYDIAKANYDQEWTNNYYVTPETEAAYVQAAENLSLANSAVVAAQSELDSAQAQLQSQLAAFAKT